MNNQNFIDMFESDTFPEDIENIEDVSVLFEVCVSSAMKALEILTDGRYGRQFATNVFICDDIEKAYALADAFSRTDIEVNEVSFC